MKLTIRYLDGTPNEAAPKGSNPRRGGRRGRGGGGTGAAPGVTNRDFLSYGALALGLHGDPAGVDAVRGILRSSRDAKVQSNAAIAMVLLRRSKAIDDLGPILEDTGSAVTSGAIIMALGLVPRATPELVETLKKQYERDRNPDSVRAMAVIGLGALGDPRAIPFSVRLVRDYNYLIRCCALDLIASLL